MSNNNKAKKLYFTLIMLLILFIQNALAEPKVNINELLDTANKIRSNDPEEFSTLIALLMTKSEQMNTQQYYYFQYLTAYKLTFNSKAQEALPLLLNILAADAAGALIKFRARLTIINIFAIRQRWSQGLFHLSTLLKESPNIEHQEIHLDGLTIAAVFYNQLGQYDLGKKYAEIIQNKKAKERTLCASKQLIIESKFYLNQLQKNDSDIQDAINTCSNEPIMANFIRSYLSKLLIKNNDSKGALEVLTPYLQVIKSTKYPRLIVEIYTSLAEAYWQQGNLEKTEEFAKKSTEVGENIKTTQAVVAAYKLLYQVAKKQNKHIKALALHEVHTELDKTYLNETQAKHLAFQLAEHQAIEQENRIDLLKEKNALLTSEKSLLTAEQALTRANAENTRLIILVLVLTLSVLTFWGYRLLKAHKRIKELAEYDALTGIFNRGHFTQVANNALRYCQSAGQELSLIMFDLDFFNKINDTYGHACGDWALKTTVEACKSIGRQNDIFARLGGEEFCILLTSCDKQAARLRAEACRQAIEGINTADSGFEFTITASFGVTDVKTSGFELEKILADADSAAYSAKHAGRNQVSIFEHEIIEEATTSLDASRNVF